MMALVTIQFSSSQEIHIGLNTLNKPLDITRTWEEYLNQQYDNNDEALTDAFNYCNESDVWKFIACHGAEPSLQIIFLTPCENAKIIEYVDFNSLNYWKTDKLNVLSIRPFADYLNESDERIQTAISKNPRLIEYVRADFLSDDLVRKAVESDGKCISFVHEQTPDVCWISVRQNACNLEFIKPENQSHDLCMYAILQDAKALQFVANQTREICISAIQREPFAVKYVRDQTREICLEAVSRQGMAIQFIKVQTFELCKIAALQNFNSLMKMNKCARRLLKKVWNSTDKRYDIIDLSGHTE